MDRLPKTHEEEEEKRIKEVGGVLVLSVEDWTRLMLRIKGSDWELHVLSWFVGGSDDDR